MMGKGGYSAGVGMDVGSSISDCVVNDQHQALC